MSTAASVLSAAWQSAPEQFKIGITVLEEAVV
jgi:hypothetical protein